MSRHLLSLEDATERLRPFRRRYLGVRTIDVASIIGTESRLDDFDRDFSALKRNLRERQRQIAQAFPNGEFPAITVEKMGDAYFVIDGHHRVALARRRGMATIDAEVTEVTARWHLSALADLDELRHAEQERLFMAESGLGCVRPDARFRFSLSVGYRQLLETIEAHGFRLMLELERPLERGDVASHWYSTMYLPAVELVSGEQLDGACAHATESDLFLWLRERQRDLAVERGSLTLPEVVRMTVRDGARKKNRVRARFSRR